MICEKVAELNGSRVGVGGAGVWAALPVDLLNVNKTAAIAYVEASTRFAPAGLWPAGSPVDSVDLQDSSVWQPSVVLALTSATRSPGEEDFAPADLSSGHFSSTIDTSGFAPGDYTVWARACLAGTCSDAASARVSLG